MTGKKILNASGKGRATYQSTANQHILVNVPKNPIKQSISAASISSPMANKFSSIPPATPTSTIVPNTPASFTTIIKTSENLKYLPLYSAAVTKPSTDSFAAEDLDSIQLELELLLSAVALRYRSLKTSFDSLDREDKKKSDKHGSAATVKRKRDDAKKQGKDAKSSQPAKITKVKANSIDSPSYSQHTDDSMDAQPMQSSQTPANSQPNPKLLLPKNDLPNKFWLSVEPYCMPITQEDVKLLEDMIEEYSKPLLPPIPDLGSHYTSRWAAEDLRDEQDNSNSNAKANKRFTNAATPNVTKMLKKGEDEIGEGEFACTSPTVPFSIISIVSFQALPDRWPNGLWPLYLKKIYCRRRMVRWMAPKSEMATTAIANRPIKAILITLHQCWKMAFTSSNVSKKSSSN